LTSYSFVDHNSRNKRQEQLRNEKRKQRGIEFPNPADQPHYLTITLDLCSIPPETSPSLPSSQLPFPKSFLGDSKDALRSEVQKGLKRLCTLFEQIDIRKKNIDKLDKDGNLIRVPLSDFEFPRI
jgi:hypothetical protein